jgi:fructokinase
LEVATMRTLAFGDMLWDVFGNESHMGGAAFNAAAHLAKLGAESYLISAVGDDRLGDAAISTAEKYGICVDYIERRPGANTGTVTVSLSSDGQPTYKIQENAAWDMIELSCDDLSEIAAEKWDYLIFGTLPQRTEKNRLALRALLDAIPPTTKRVYDINLRQHFHRPEWIRNSLANCDILKINEDEAVFLSKALFGGQANSPEATARELSKRHFVETVIVTLGGEGAGVFSNDEWTKIDGVKVDVADTVGAGDSFTAATLFAMAHGKNAPDAVRFGVEMGAFVASRRGAVPDYSARLKDEIAKLVLR